MITPLGTVSVGQLNVGVAMVMPGILAYKASLAAKLLDINKNIAFAAGLQVPDPALLLASAAAFLANLDSLITKLPTATITVKADLVLQLGKIMAEIAIIGELLARIEGVLSAGGVDAYAFEGKARDLSAELAPHVTGNENAHALVLVARDPAAWAALSTVLMTG